MAKLYIKWAHGDAVYTDQIKLTHGFDFEDVSAEIYLQHIEDIAPKKTRKFKFIGKKEVKTPVIDFIPKGKVYGPQLPTVAQLRKSNERIAAENKIKIYQAEKRLSRRFGWEYLEVTAIAAAAYMRGIKAVMGDIPDEFWDKKIVDAMDEAKKSIRDWQDYELNNMKNAINQA